MIFSKLPEKVFTPPILLDTRQFLVKIAETEKEIEKALKLRYEVFNLEQGKGLSESQEKGIDSDEYDPYCLHLLVIDKGTDKAIGTYRAHFGTIANKAIGFYSSREYEIKGLDAISENCIELGRSCVYPGYRTGTVISLLWGAISELLLRSGMKYMIGCASLEVTDPLVGWAVYEYIKKIYTTGDSPALEAVPLDGYKLERPADGEIKDLSSDASELNKYMPPLFKGYLRLGAKVCGEPALDKDFGTIDFFIIVDVDNIPPRYLRYFNYINGSDR